MRRLPGSIVASALAIVMAACGGSNVGPTPNPGGGVNGGGGGQQPPPTVNTPPQVRSITVSDTRVEAGAPVTLTAVVEDAETPVANLSFAWTFPVGGSLTGSVTGTGNTFTWTPGMDLKTPDDYEITLTVTEEYTSGGAAAQNKATGTVTVHVNNSRRELAEMSLRFLADFANSGVSPEKCVAEFSDACSGKKNELADVTANRHDFLILGSTLRATGVDLAPSLTTATAHTFCAFTSRVITKTPQSEGCINDPASCKFDSIQSVQGDCWTTNVYERGRWWICTSRFTGVAPLTGFGRGFFGIRGPETP